MAEKPEVTKPEKVKIADDLYLMFVRGSALKEQDINAQVMEPKHFERLTENIRERGSLESLPYCHQPAGTGPISIVSGHHRARAARAAGLAEFAVLVDTRVMTLSEVRAKQIAHNELHGTADEAILRRMIAQIETVDDMLMTGLTEEFIIPEPEVPSTSLQLPHADFDWRLVTLTFLPKQMEDFREAVEQIDSATDFIGVAQAEQFEEFSKAVYDYSKISGIKNMATVLATLAEIARREVAAAATSAEAEEPATE